MKADKPPWLPEALASLEALRCDPVLETATDILSEYVTSETRKPTDVNRDRETGSIIIEFNGRDSLEIYQIGGFVQIDMLLQDHYTPNVDHRDVQSFFNHI